MKKIYLISLLTAFSITDSHAQSIAKATIGTAGGEFRNGNISLSFTIGESFVGLQSSGNTNISNGFWSVVPAGYTPTATTIYRFTGNGNFTDAANWENNTVPPNPLPAAAEIFKNPSGTGQCNVNIPYTVSAGGKFSVAAGKKLLVAGNLVITAQ